MAKKKKNKKPITQKVKKLVDVEIKEEVKVEESTETKDKLEVVDEPQDQVVKEPHDEVPFAGIIKKTVGTGGRAGRVQYEILEAKKTTKIIQE